MVVPTPIRRSYPFRRIPRVCQQPTTMNSQQTANATPLLLILILVAVVAFRKQPPETPVPPVSMKRGKGILMSCPPGPAHTNKGPWKPSLMTLGIEAVIKQQVRHNSSLPFFLGYYSHEQSSMLPYCEKLSQRYPVNITCFMIPEKYPVGLYGYAKILALRHAPLKEVLWLDCDIYPLRRLDKLFDDVEFHKTGAMFWPDSRDFFEERKVFNLLPRASQAKFPVDAWYVRQGFDSGILLLDTLKSHRQIEEMSRIARSPKERVLRKMSMGDKDIFHIVWMLHGKNFSLVPFIGETGSLQAARRSVRLLKSSNRLVAKRVHWVMSSQVKHGRDGSPYALHQLHKQQPFSLIATLSGEHDFFTSRVTRSTSHVKPFLHARKDLRLKDTGNAAQGRAAEFVGQVENALIGSAGIPKIVKQQAVISQNGITLERTPNWLHAAASEMGRSWKYGSTADAVAEKVFQSYRKRILMKRVDGGYRKPIYKRLWKERSQRVTEFKRRNLKKFRREVEEDKGLRRIING